MLAPGVAEWIGREQVTVWNGVPAQLYDLARQPGLGERLGEKVAVLVQLGAEIATSDLETLCRRHLARYKVPETWPVVDSFPKNAMGKIIRTSLPGLLAQNPAPGGPRG